MVRLYAMLLCFSDPCYYFKLKTLKPVSLPFLLFNKIHEFQALFCKTTQACPGFRHGFTSFRASAFFSCRSTAFCRLRNIVRHNWLIKIDTKPSLLCPTLLCGEFCGRTRWIQPFFVYSAILCFALPCTSWKRCRQSHQVVVDHGRGMEASLLSQGLVYHPPITPVFDLLTAADGKDMSLELKQDRWERAEPEMETTALGHRDGRLLKICWRTSMLDHCVMR